MQEKNAQNKQTFATLMERANKLEHMLEESMGEITPEIEAEMEKLGQDIDEKLQVYAYVAKKLQAEQKQYQEAERMFKQKHIAAKNAEKRVRELANMLMSRAGIEKAKGYYTLYIRLFLLFALFTPFGGTAQRANSGGCKNL